MLIREVTAGWSRRVRLENHVALQRAELVRPAQVRLEVVTILHDINQQLKADPELKKLWDTVKITVPTAT
jgi:predicted secreted Zn-dependent protease